MCAETKVMLKPQTKKPNVKSIKPLWLKASFRASTSVWLSILLLTFIFFYFLNSRRNIAATTPSKTKYKYVFSVFSQP